MKRENWIPVGYHRSIWRKVRDAFDDTSYNRTKKRLDNKFKQLTYTKKDEYKEFCPAPVVQTNFISSTKIEDYCATSTDSVEVIAIPKKIPYFISVPVKTLHFRIERSKKIIAIKLPRIKVNIPTLKRLALATSIGVLIIVLFLSSFITYRIIALTDGDFFGETYKMRMAKYEQDTVDPIYNNIEGLKVRMLEMEARQDAKEYREMIGWKHPVKKTYKIYNRKGELREITYQ